MASDGLQRVTVTDIDVSFGQLVFLLIKVTFAAIPAAIIVAIIGTVLTLVMGGFIAALRH